MLSYLLIMVLFTFKSVNSLLAPRSSICLRSLHRGVGQRIQSSRRPSILKLAVDTRVDSEARAENEKISAKRKMALTLGYVGTKYYGLQIDTKNNISTVEKAILQALLSAGCVSERNAEDLVKIGWSRSSRTDKGVHAARIVVSGKLLVDKRVDFSIQASEYIARINTFLPEDIRVFSCVKLNQGFRAREACSWREYEYILPLSLIDGKVEEFNSFLVKFQGSHSFHNFHRVARKELNSSRRDAAHSSDDEDDISSDDNDDDGIDEAETYCEKIDSNKISSVASKVSRELWSTQEVFSVFESWKGEDRIINAKTKRNIYLCGVHSVFKVNGVDMVKVRIRGQSFMLHQIRLMIGSAVLVVLEIMPKVAIDCALKAPNFIGFPLAPANGLVLKTAGFGMNCNHEDICMTHEDKLDDEIVLLDSSSEKIADRFLSEKIYPQILGDWLEESGMLAEKWRSYNSKRYAVGNSLHEIWTKLYSENSARLAQEDSDKLTKERSRVKSILDKGLTSDTFVIENIPHKNILPNGIATAISVKFKLVPCLVTTSILRMIAIDIIEKRIPFDISIEDILKVLESTEGGLQTWLHRYKEKVADVFRRAKISKDIDSLKKE